MDPTNRQADPSEELIDEQGVSPGKKAGFEPLGNGFTRATKFSLCYR